MALQRRKEGEIVAQAQKCDLNTVTELARQCSNWGKWGAEDELGTINYIGHGGDSERNARRLSAAASD